MRAEEAGAPGHTSCLSPEQENPEASPEPPLLRNPPMKKLTFHRELPGASPFERLPGSTRSTLRFREAIPEFIGLLTSHTHVSLDRFESACFSRWIERWATTPVCRLTTEDLRTYLVELAERGVSRNEIDREKKLLRSFFRIAKRREHLFEDPTERLDPPAAPPPPSTVFWTAEEEDRLLAACRGQYPAGTPGRDSLRRPPAAPAYMYPLVLTGLRTGLKLSHLLGLEWTQVDLEAGQISIPACFTWNHRDLVVPLDHEVREALKTLRDLAEKLPLLPRKVFESGGLPLWKDRPDDFAIHHALSRLVKAAYITPGDFDAIRLTHARRCAEAAIPLQQPVRLGDWEDATPVQAVYEKVAAHAS